MKEYKKLNTDILIIGAGVAGMSCALSLPDNLSIMLIAKGSDKDCSTYYAQGGIACVMSSDDSYQKHIQDTLIAGAGICDESIVKFVIQSAKGAITWLESQGVIFNRNANKTYHLTREGGHSERRILHSDDATGLEVHRALLDKVKSKKNIDLKYNMFAVDLLTNNNICNGARVLDKNNNNLILINSKKTLLASGGCSRVYQYSSNPYSSTGDGIAMAIRAGASISHLEFNQFHPTCLYHPKAYGLLLSEALRGEGAKLKLPDGNRFMDKYHKLAELAPRDIVTRAIDSEMKKYDLPCVYLDISHRDDAFIKSHFPNIYKNCLKFGFDLTKDPVPIVPAAHYSCGGVCVDKNAKTSICNLYAIGEVSYTGLHGANRMASNSLLECVVYALSASDYIKNNFKININSNISDESYISHKNNFDNYCLQELEIGLLSNLKLIKKIMWEHVGIIRSNKGLLLARKKLNKIYKDIRDIRNIKINNKANNLIYSYYECLNLLDVSLSIINSSLTRKESVGLHFVCDVC